MEVLGVVVEALHAEFTAPCWEGERTALMYCMHHVALCTAVHWLECAYHLLPCCNVRFHDVHTAKRTEFCMSAHLHITSSSQLGSSRQLGT